MESREVHPQKKPKKMSIPHKAMGALPEENKSKMSITQRGVHIEETKAKTSVASKARVKGPVSEKIAHNA